MLQLRGLQDDSKHEELQRLWQETILQCVSSRFVSTLWVSVGFLPSAWSPVVFDLSERQTLDSLNVCTYVGTHLRPLSLPLHCWLSAVQPLTPPREKAYVWCGKVCVSLPPSHRGRGVATKEIPKVPLQWHRRTVWKLACPLMVPHMLAHQKITRNLPFTLNDFFPSFVNRSPWHGIWGKRITSCSYEIFLVFFFFPSVGFSVPEKLIKLSC